MKISATIVTLNEENNIQRCLASLDFADEIIVVDTGSTDATVKIARSLGAKIFHTKFSGFSNIKNLAISKTRHPWIFSIDADEEATPELKTALLRLAADRTAADGYRIKRDTMFLGRRIKHCGWGKDYQLRFFRKAKGEFDGKPVHESVAVKGAVGTLGQLLLHYSYPDSRVYFEKMNRYTTLQAEEKQKSFLLLRMLTAPFLKFFRMYFIKAGFLDGLQGFILSVYSGFSEFVKFSKMRMIKLRGKSTARDSIVVRMPNWLGDAVMATALLKPIKALYTKTIILCDKSVKTVFENNPYVDELLAFDKKKPGQMISTAAKVRKINPSIAVSLTPSLSSAFMLWLTGAGIRAGFAEDMGGMFLNRIYYRDKCHTSLHIIEEYEKVLYLADTAFDFKDAQQELFITDKAAQRKTLKKFGISAAIIPVIAAPFVKYGKAKMWPESNWEKLIITLLEKDKRVRVFIAGTAQDMKYALPEKLIASKRVEDLRGQTSLKELLVILKHSKLFLGNDSGLMHAADALKIPLVGIFASTSAKWTGPVNPKSRAIGSGVDCAPCFDRECRYGHYKCMKEITPEKVLKLI